MNRWLYGVMRRAGIPVRDALKRVGLLGPLDRALAGASHRLAPTMTTDALATLPGGLRLHVPAGLPSGPELISGSYEPLVTQAFLRLVDEGATVVDIGANVGYYTLLAAARVGPSGRVHAFEPDPTAYEWLRRSVSENRFEHVQVHPIAVSDREGKATFHRWQLEWGSLVLEFEGGEQVEVETTTLDAYLFAKGWPPVDVVKLDIEGGEAAALSGMVEAVRRNPQLRLLMELNPEALRRIGMTADQLGERLREVGFRRGQVIERGLRHFDLPDLPRSRALHNLILTPAAG